jgi:hypothetical protein
MTTQFPEVRPSQRIRNTARAIKLSARGGEYPTNADILEDIAVAVAENEEIRAELSEVCQEVVRYVVHGFDIGPNLMKRLRDAIAKGGKL